MKTCLILLLTFLLSVTSAQTQFVNYRTNYGLIKQSGYFTNKKLDSVWVMYNHKGDTVSIAHYQLGIKVGIWSWKEDNKLCKLYYRQGRKTKYEEYINNKLITKKDL